MSKLADCLAKHGKVFTPAERADLLETAKQNAADGMDEAEAGRAAVAEAMKEAQADLKDVVDALPKPSERERRKGSAFLQELKQAGGIDPKEAREIMGDSAMMLNRRMPGISRNGGMSGDALGEWLVDMGYLTNAEMDDADRNKTGGSIERAYELVRKALNDEDVVPMRDEYSAMQRRMEEDAKWVEEQAQSAVDETGPDWSTMSDEQKDAHLDTIFGPDTGPAKTPAAASEGARQGEAAARPEVPAERPSLELASHTEAEVKAKEEQANTGEVEERTAAVRDRDEAVLSPPEGTAPPRDVAEAKVPTQQEGLFSRAPVFYSELSKQIERASMSAAPAKSWHDYLRGLLSKGVKPDEIEWSGVNDWLGLQQGKVTKQQVSDYLAQNGVRVEEKMLGHDAETEEKYNKAAAAAAQASEKMERVWRSVELMIPPIKGVDRMNIPWWGYDMANGDAEAEKKARAVGLDDVQIKALRQYGEVRKAFAEAEAKRRALEMRGGKERTKFQQYTLPGGENYRELLLTLPEAKGQRTFEPSKVEIRRDLRSMTQGSTSIYYDGERLANYGDDPQLQSDGSYKQKSDAHWMEVAKRVFENGDERNSISSKSGSFRSSHFDQPNILAHIRFNERWSSADGTSYTPPQKVLFIEEIQSDWAQKGKREGFKPAGDEFFLRKPDGDIGQDFASREEGEQYLRDHPGAGTIDRAHREGVPSAPFVGKTEAWVGLALKRMIRYAAENGFDRMAWTNGEQQADRYSLDKHISGLRLIDAWAKYPTQREGHINTRRGVSADKPLLLLAYDKAGNVVIEKGVSEADLPDLIGKEAAQRLLESERLDKYERGLTGVQLRVGGEGMRAFYDKIIPNIVNDVLKKLGGGRVSLVTFEKSTPESKTWTEAHTDPRTGEIGAQLGFDITPKMRETALGGLPLFNRAQASRGLKHDAISQVIEPILEKWKNAPEVSIIGSMADAPQAVKLTYMRQQEGGAAGEPEAFIYRNKVYLVADSLATPMAALRALLHESVGHFGLRNTFGERLDPILDEVAKSLPTRMKAKAREYGLNLGDAAERRQAAEEVLAEMAQTMPQLGVVKKLIAAFRQFLRDIGVQVSLSDNDIIANYILPARGFVERGELTRMVDSPAFSRMSAAIETARGKNYKELATRFVDRLDQALNPLGTLPEQEKYLIRRYEAQGHIEKADEAAKAIRAALPIASESDQQAIFDYLTTAGANSGAIVDAAARRSAEQIKADINRVGDELVAHGLLAEESRAQYRDAYLPRLYLKHLLSESDWRALGAGKKPSDMGYLKARQDIPEDVRKVILGEVRDPGFLAAVAVAKPMRDMALLDWLGDISQNDKWILPDSMVDFTSPLTGKSQKATPFWLKNEAIRLRKQARYYAPEEAQKAEREARAMDQAADDVLEGAQGTHENYKQIPNTARYGRLRGLLVRSEIYDDMMGVQDFLPTDPGWFQNVFGYGGVGTKATQIWKAMKVSMNPPAQIRNFVSNGIAMQLFAGVPLRLLPARVIQGTREVLDNGKYFQIAKKYGVGASTFATQEVYRMKTELLDLEMKTRGMGPLGRLHRLAGLVMNKAGDFYQTSETIFKTATIIDAMERQGMSEQQAVLLANKALFDYSLVQKSLRYARSAPIGAPFATYAIKVLPRLVETALHHPQRFLPWVGLFYGFPMLAASMLGVNKDDLDKLKMAMPQWLQDKGHALILPYKDEQGRWQVVDLGYFMPWTNWTELAGNVASGELGKAVQGAGIFGGPLTDIITAIKTGKDPFTGKDILAKGDPPERQAVALLNYVWDMAMPPILTDRGLLSPMGLLDKAYGGKLEQAFSGTTNKFGEPRATATQALLYAAGVNVNALTPEYTRAMNLQAMQRDMQDVKHQMVQKLYDRSLSEEQRRDIAKEYAAELIRRTDKMKKYMRESEIAPALAAQH